MDNGTMEETDANRFLPVTQLSVVPVTLPGSSARVKRPREEMATSTSGVEYDTPQKAEDSDDDAPSPKVHPCV